MNLIVEFSIFGVAAVFFFISYTAENTKTTLVTQIISVALFSLGIYLHGVKEASAMISIYSLIPMFAGLFFSEKAKRNTSKMVPFIAIATLSYVSWDIGTIIIVIASFFGVAAALKDDVYQMKVLYLICNILWLSFDFYIGSVGAIMFDMVGMFALLLFFRKRRFTHISD